MDDLDTLVRRVDEDRWLASRFAPEQVRQALIALYAVNYEIAHTAEAAREPALGDIRREWWRQALEEIAEGKAPRSHPALTALCASPRAMEVARIMMGVAETRASDSEAAPFKTWEALETYVAGTARALMVAASDIASAGLDSGEGQRFLDFAARAWAYCGLLRAQTFWQARGRSFIPEGATLAEMSERAQSAYSGAKVLSVSLPAEGFPALGYVALVPGYLRVLARNKRETALLLRQATLVAASATGRL